MRVAFAFVFSVATSAALAASDFEVTVSNVPAYPAKSKLTVGTQISVPDGGEIHLKGRSGATPTTKACFGKYEGPVEKCPWKANHSGSDPAAATGASRAPRKATPPQQ
jgi:hypothetical protein